MFFTIVKTIPSPKSLNPIDIAAKVLKEVPLVSSAMKNKLENDSKVRLLDDNVKELFKLIFKLI